MKVKKFIKIAFVSMFAATALAACGTTLENPVSSVSLNETKVGLERDEEFQLIPTIEPANATLKDVKWKSSNDQVAKVDEDGLVTTLKDGVVTITCTTVDGKKKASCDFEIKTQNYIFSGEVSKKQSFINYASNKSESLNDNEKFAVRDANYYAGSLNAFNVLPKYTILTEGGLPTSQLKWKYDHTFDIKYKDGDKMSKASSDMYEIVDYRKCDIQFKNAAVGKVFKISVTPGGLSAERLGSGNYTATYENIEVVDGFNIYNAKELSYVNTLLEEKEFKDDAERQDYLASDAYAWVEFKKANGIDPDLHPNTFIFQDNIKLTSEDMPKKIFFQKEDGVPAAVIGSMKDWSEPYRYNLSTPLKINGNFFKLDYKELPTVTYNEGAFVSDSFVSHTSLFVAENGNLTMENLNVSGNAYLSKTKTNEGGQQVTDTSGRGGFIFVKARDLCGSVKFNNIISRGCFITLLTEKANTALGYVDCEINYYKGYDNYNSFLYNWGGNMTVSNSTFESCGGPVVIQDHTGVEEGEPYSSEDGKTVYGQPSTTTFIDCDIKNYVSGTEAWFVQFGAVGLVGNIKSMSDLLASKGATFLSVKDGDKYVPACASQSTSDALYSSTYQTLRLPTMSESKPAFFNFIALNKSSNTEGQTTANVHGEVSIISTEKNTNNCFCYSRPNMNREDEIADLMTLAVKYGLYNEANRSLFDQLKAAQQQAKQQIEIDAQYHRFIRGANGAGAPVFQCGSNYGMYNPQASTTDLVFGSTTFTPVSQDFASYKDFDGNSHIQPATSIYFNGMMLVFGLQSNGLMELMAQMSH